MAKSSRARAKKKYFTEFPSHLVRANVERIGPKRTDLGQVETRISGRSP